MAYCIPSNPFAILKTTSKFQQFLDIFSILFYFLICHYANEYIPCVCVCEYMYNGNPCGGASRQHRTNSREHQHKVSVHGARSMNYRSIDWTKPHIDELFGMYVQEPLSMQCNQSNGYRFPGYDWEGAPSTPATIQVPLRRFETCENFNPYGVIPLEQGDCGYLGECIY